MNDCAKAIELTGGGICGKQRTEAREGLVENSPRTATPCRGRQGHVQARAGAVRAREGDHEGCARLGGECLSRGPTSEKEEAAFSQANRRIVSRRARAYTTPSGTRPRASSSSKPRPHNFTINEKNPIIWHNFARSSGETERSTEKFKSGRRSKEGRERAIPLERSPTCRRGPYHR